MLSTLSYKNVEVVGNGSVYENKSGKQTLGFAFYYRTKDGKKNRKVVTASTEEDLRKKAIIFLDKLDKEYEENKKAVNITNTAIRTESINVTYNNVPEPVRVTFKEIGDRWYKEYSGRLNQPIGGISCSSVENRELCFRTICKHIGDMYIDEINQDTAKDIINLCSFKDDGTKYSFSHMDKLQQTFHMIMKYADKHGLYKYKLNKESLNIFLKADTNSRFMDREQIAEIMDLLMDNERYSLVVEFIVASGLRQEELFALTINDFHVVNENKVDINIDNSIRRMYRTVYKKVDLVKTKNSRRKVVIPYNMYEKIMNYYNSIIEKESIKDKQKRIENGTVGFIFVNKDKKVLNKKTFQRNFKDYLKRRIKKLEKELGYDTTLHMFRHSFASLSAEKLSMEVVAELLGDSMKTVKENYYSLSDKVTDEVSANTLDVLDSINKIRSGNK